MFIDAPSVLSDRSMHAKSVWVCMCVRVRMCERTVYTNVRAICCAPYPAPPEHNIMLLELAAALLAAMRSPHTHTGYAALGCASHGCFSLLLYAPVSGFQDCELRCAVPKRPPSQHPHLVCLFVCVCVYVLTYQSCM